MSSSKLFSGGRKVGRKPGPWEEPWFHCARFTDDWHFFHIRKVRKIKSRNGPDIAILHQHLTHKSTKGHLNIDFFLEEFKQEGSGMKDIRMELDGENHSQWRGGYCR